MRRTKAVVVASVVLMMLSGVMAEEPPVVEDAEVDPAEDIVQKTTVVQLLKEETEQVDNAVHDLDVHVSDELTSITSHFEEMITDLRDRERSMEDRIVEVERRARQKVEDGKKIAEMNQSKGWVWAYGGVFLALLGLTYVAHREWDRVSSPLL